jgi:hypothetical protein
MLLSADSTTLITSNIIGIPFGIWSPLELLPSSRNTIASWHHNVFCGAFMTLERIPESQRFKKYTSAMTQTWKRVRWEEMERI